MPKQSLELIQNSISTFDLNSSEDKLSHGFKVAKTQQEFHKQQSEEFNSFLIYAFMVHVACFIINISNEIFPAKVDAIA